MPVVIHASARWRHQLSDLSVSAQVTAPSRARQDISFHDDVPDRRNSGDYQGVYQPTEDGRHRAVVTIVGSPSATIADPIGRLSHSETGTIDTDPGAPSFVREVVVSVDVGGRGEPGEWEEEMPSLDRPHRPRPVELVSAPLTSLADTGASGRPYTSPPRWSNRPGEYSGAVPDLSGHGP
jgi:hypothetical protein